MRSDRALYAAEYLASNCTLADYDETTEFDDSWSTILTNYAIGVVGLLSALALLYRKRSRVYFWIIFFLLNAVGYTLAGVYHHIATDLTNNSERALYFVAIGITILAIPALELTLTSHKVGRILFLVSNAAVFAICIALQTEMLPAVWSFGSYFCLSVYYGWKKRCTHALGCALVVIGFFVLGVFHGTCGSSQQKDCFRDCIFPDPTQFNQNGIFHIFVALGIIALAVAEVKESTQTQTKASNRRGSSVTKDAELGESDDNLTPGLVPNFSTLAS